MDRRTLLAIAIMALATTSSLSPLITGQGYSPNLTVVSSLSPFLMEPAANNTTAYTLYVPPTSSDRSQINSILEQDGITTSRTGSLWSFSVPTSYNTAAVAVLNQLQNRFGISYSQAAANPIVYPSVSASNITQITNIPFAYTPSVIAKAYQFNWALEHGINGSGQTIVIVDAYGDPNIQYDVNSFDAMTGLPPVHLSVIYPLGKPGNYNSTWAMETSTDVEWAHALAPGAKIVLAVSVSPYTSDLQKVVSYAVDNRLGNIISLSWGSPEQNIGLSTVSTYNRVYSQAASQGITVVAASGDSGAYDSSGKLSVEYPSSDPYVTGVGGTSLYVLNNKFQQYGWGGIINNQSYGSGGGYSLYFGTPYWQHVNGHNGTQRGVPDVAMDSDRYTGVYVVTQGGQYMIGGTSVATPMWADVAALLSQYNGYSFHSINPLLYQIARTNLYNSSFTQILTGTNGYYRNGPGWNPVTGLGTPEVSNLLNASRQILAGYGAVAIMNSSSTYNSTSVRADLGLQLNASNMQNNGSTFYYAGFYGSSGNYARFGVLANTSGESLMLEFSQNDVKVVKYYPMPAGYTGSFTGLSIMLSYTGSALGFTTSGGMQGNIPAFLNFSGEMSPAVGVQQIFTETNLTEIGNGTFSNIQTLQGSVWNSTDSFFFQHYSEYSSPTYSTIDANASGDNLTFYTSSAHESGQIGNVTAQNPEIMFRLSYGYPLSASFYVSGYSGQAKWFVNGTAISGSTFTFPADGGVFPVSAQITVLAGETASVNRTITVPSIAYRNLSVNTTSSGFPDVVTDVTAMWFYSYAYPQSQKIPVLNTTSVISATSSGFYTYNGEGWFTGNISIKMVPQPVSITVFAFPGNATVTVNGTALSQNGGYHTGQVLPAANMLINATAPGYMNYSRSVEVYPGRNLSLQISLSPVDNSSVKISGRVTDSLYFYNLGGVNVSADNTSHAYTNSTGYYVLYVPAGKYNISALADLYMNYSTVLNVSSDTVLDIQLTPAEISLTTTSLVSISHYFPLLFYLGFISWNDYKGGNFSSYQIYISTSQDFLNARIITVSSQNTSYSFLTGIVPGHTYYISVVLRLANDQVYQSQVVRITYGNPVYLGLNLVILGGIGFYVYTAYRIFRKKNREIDQ